MQRYKNILVVYHNRCTDGTFAAATAVILLSNLNIPIKHMPMDYDQEWDHTVKDHLVVAVDFSFRPEVCRAISEHNSLVIIDHHKSAIDNLATYIQETGQNVCYDIDDLVNKRDYSLAELLKIKNVLWVMDRRYCGTVLTFMLLNHLAKVATSEGSIEGKSIFDRMPKLLHYINDRDLWKKQMTGTDEIAAYLKAKVFSVDQAIDTIMAYRTDNVLDTMIDAGHLICQSTSSLIEDQIEAGLHCVMFAFTERYVRSLSPFLTSAYKEMKAQYSRKATLIDDGVEGIVVPACVMPQMLSSDACVEIMQHVDFPIAATYNYESSGSIKWSFRSTNEKAIVLATLLGGGGHLNAAGAYTRLGKQAETSFFFGDKGLRLVQIFSIGE